MWKPPERIRHPLPPARWPSADEVRGSRLFSPLEAGRLRLAERTWVPAMVPWRARESGEVTPEVLAWYERLARGRPGALVVEATGIRDVPSGPLLRIGSDHFVPGLRELVATVRGASEGGTRLFLQILDFLGIRRRPQPEVYFARYLEIRDAHREAAGTEEESAVRAFLAAQTPEEWPRLLSPRELEDLRFGARERIDDLHLAHVRELPRSLPPLFAAAAVRARAAGFDGVELHCAHAYTLASFLSRRNQRSDGYGGSPAARLRLPLEVLAAVRAAVGEDFVVGARLLTEECIEGGSGLEDSAGYARGLAAAGIDFLSFSRGGKFEDARQPRIGWAAYPYTGPSGYECMPTALSDARGPFGRNVAPTAALRAALRAAGLPTPVVVAGGIDTFDAAEAVLERGEADVVAAARQSLADPDWWRKMRLGMGAEVRRCVYSNYCEGLDQMHKQVTCQLWDREALDEPGVARSRDGRRRLVAPVWEPLPSKKNGPEVDHPGAAESEAEPA